MKRTFDLIFLGAGLSAGLAAIRLRKIRPEIRIALIEQGTISDRTSPTWSFHEGDLSPQAFQSVAPFLSQSWDRYEVAFPEYRRVLNSKYFSIRASDFYAHLKATCGDFMFENRRVVECKDGWVRTETEQWSARHVLDARGWGGGSANLKPAKKGEVGFQKFFGMDLELESPHGLKFPVLMDATVSQLEGFRFFYLLPWSPQRLLVEDTRYTLNGELDEDHMRLEILKYVDNQGWKIARIERSERGCLSLPFARAPEPTESDFSGALPWGVRGGLFHPTTGYSFLCASEMAEWLVSDAVKAELLQTSFVTCLNTKRKSFHRKQFFFRWINRMLFWQKPAERYRLLQRFYRLPEDTVARFYSMRFRFLDYLRLFSGKPPIPTVKAFGILSERKRVQFDHVS